MPGQYTYLGGQVLMYQGYLDDATGKMLVADPDADGPYSMSPAGDAMPVPPSDGRWAEYSAAVQPVLPAPPPSPVPVPDDPAPEGGD